MVFVVFPAFVLPQENLDVTPRALSCISVGAGVRIHELDAVVHGAMRVTLTKAFSNIAICRPRHISATGITLHLTPKQTDVL